MRTDLLSHQFLIADLMCDLVQCKSTFWLPRNTKIDYRLFYSCLQLLKEYEYLIMQSYDSNEALHF